MCPSTEVTFLFSVSDITEHHEKTRQLAIIVGSSVGGGVLIAVLVMFCCCMYHKQKEVKRMKEIIYSNCNYSRKNFS